MSNARTLLSPLQQGDTWRVQIVWPNGTVHHVGKFGSANDAAAWIAAHANLTTPAEGREIAPESVQRETA